VFVRMLPLHTSDDSEIVLEPQTLHIKIFPFHAHEPCATCTYSCHEE